MEGFFGIHMKRKGTLKSRSDAIGNNQVVRCIPVEEPYPPVDLYDMREELLLLADLPGVKVDSIEVECHGDSVILRGCREGGRLVGAVRQSERRKGAFERVIRVGELIDRERVRFWYADGVLTICLPRARMKSPQCN
jgi:HSP20 family protein